MEGAQPRAKPSKILHPQSEMKGYISKEQQPSATPNAQSDSDATLLRPHQSFSAPTLLPVILLLSLKLANVAAILLLCCWPNPNALSLVVAPSTPPPLEVFAGAYLSLNLLISRRRFRHGEKCSPPSRLDQTRLNTLALSASSRTKEGRLDAETTFGSEAGEISGKAGAERTAIL